MLFVFWGISYKTKKKYTYLYFIYYKHDRHVANNQIRSYILIILLVFRCSLNVINSLAYGTSMYYCTVIVVNVYSFLYSDFIITLYFLSERNFKFLALY